MDSATISIAPMSASCALATSFSSLIKALASSSIGFFVICSNRILARGSSPFSFATVARVRRFGRYGRYKSSTTTNVCAARICSFSSSVSFPCSSMVESTCSFFSSRLRRYARRSERFLSCSSLNAPVASFRYLAMKGIVFPSSISFTAAST